MVGARVPIILKMAIPTDCPSLLFLLFSIAINNKDIITGYFTTSDGQTHGFFGGVDGNYTSFDFGTGSTVPRNINDKGVIVGTAPDPNAGFVNGREFIRMVDGFLAPIEKRGVPLDGFPGGIRDDGLMVLDWIDQSQQKVTPYTAQRGKHLRRLPIVCSDGPHYVRPRDINDDGTIVGYCKTSIDHSQAFIFKDGVLTLVAEPNTYQTSFFGINKNETISGWSCEDDQCIGQHAFVYDPANSLFTDIAVPGAAWSNAAGISDAGVVTVNTDIGPFLYCQRKKACPANGSVLRTEDQQASGHVLRALTSPKGAEGISDPEFRSHPVTRR